ncbi:ATP-binding protein [Fibrobacteria bacterium R8-3-H12]
MEKSVIKSIITAKQREILSIDLVERQLDIEKAMNYVFVGLRRAGKSYMLYQHIQSLIKTGQASIEDILFVSFEDERFADIKAKDLGIFLEAYRELFNRKPMVFLDEIQNISGWEKFARRLADSKYRVFITGSNAQMLSKEIHTTLGGRFLVKEVFPFSFAEFLNFNKIRLKKNWEYNSDLCTDIARIFKDYFYYGGFAESFPLQDKRGYLNSLYQKILLGDIVARNSIRGESTIRVLVKKLAESVLQPTAASRIKNIIEAAGLSISRNTLTDYLKFLEDAYLLFGISNYSDKLSEKETIKKRYFGDNGLLNNFLFEPDAKLLENIVAIQLKKKYGDRLFYYNKNIEVDFFIPSEKKAIQVSCSIANEKTKEREVKALLKLSETYLLRHLEIITCDSEFSIAQNGKTINVVPIWKWLCWQP